MKSKLESIKMKGNLIWFIILIGIAVLFIFPSPEENFLAYFLTALFFVILVVFLIKRDRRRKLK